MRAVDTNRRLMRFSGASLKPHAPRPCSNTSALCYRLFDSKAASLGCPTKVSIRSRFPLPRLVYFLSRKNPFPGKNSSSAPPLWFSRQAGRPHPLFFFRLGRNQKKFVPAISPLDHAQARGNGESRAGSSWQRLKGKSIKAKASERILGICNWYCFRDFHIYSFSCPSIRSDSRL
ncbi:LANO_0H05776g1_1 [Lachancea nothofagi CBS 11611]|uniref:LANO_0H05776g1_1 n=1 Tax=Lachancea nothofagi CBS 11611 TaxID=1266666 RepID=A0A1G4KLK7_9SACH|nr:LANO_0H05776g1_1 [Lachancea nothofagi CBS 11611]